MATAMNATSTFSCPHNGTAHDGTLLCHWSNSPGARGTLNIFWLCISTLALCVWNAVHPDIPRPNTPWWRVFGKRLWWLFVGLFMPEMLVLVALGQFRQAWKLLAVIDEVNCAPTEFPWWMYLVKSWRPKNGNPDSPAKRWMKALRRWIRKLWLRRLRVPSRSDPDVEKGHSVEKNPSPPAASGADDALAHESSTSSDTPQHAHNSLRSAVSDPPAFNGAREHPWTLTHSFYAVMNGFVDEKGHTIPTVLEDAGSQSVLQRIELPFDDPQRIPDVSVDDIDDRGKAGVLAKSLLVWQLSVFLANCFARWHQALPLSLLEITTIGHSLCSIIALVLWWYKPHSVGEATVIDRRGRIPPPPLVWREIFSRSSLRRMINRGREKVLPTPPMDEVRGFASRVSVELNGTYIAIVVIAVLYGLPHLLGLSVHFPSSSEQSSWKIATITVIISPTSAFLSWALRLLAKRLDGARNRLRIPVVLVARVYAYYTLLFVALYTFASMFLVYESIRQIFALPEGSFHNPQLTRHLPGFS